MATNDAQRQTRLHAMAKRMLRAYPTELDLPNSFLPEGRKAIVEAVGESITMERRNDHDITIDDVLLLYLSEYAGRTIRSVE